MATIFINPTETNSLNFKKIQKKTKNSNLKSFWAFLLSLLLYFSVFYAFNLSTSTLLSTTKFWFFISNTIIFIIAADFGAFSSSKEADFYQEYAMKTTDRAVPFPFQLQLPKNDVLTMENARKEEDYQKPQEKIINTICTTTTKYDIDRIDQNHHENKPHITFIKEENANMAENLDTKEQGISIPQVKNEVHALKKRPKAASFRRNSAIEMVPKMDDKMVVKRTLSAGHEELPRCEENDEYSRMSDEELNRRVEEFIRRFNRQIRLQAISNNSPQI